MSYTGFARESFSELSPLRHREGDQVGTETLLRRILEFQERRLGADNPEALMNNLGLSIVLAQNNGDTVGAEQLCIQVVRARKRVLGNEHRDTIKAIFTLTLLFQKQKRMAEAFRIAREAMTVAQAKLPKDNPERLKYEQQFANAVMTRTP